MNRFGSAPPVIDGGDGKVLAAGRTVTARPDIGQAGAPRSVDLDATAVKQDRILHRLRHEGLADGLEDHVGLESEGLACAFKPALFLGRVFAFESDSLSVLDKYFLLHYPMLDLDDFGFCW